MKLKRNVCISILSLFVCGSCTTMSTQTPDKVWESSSEQKAFTVVYSEPFDREKFTVYNPEGSIDSSNVGINYLMTQIDYTIPSIVTKLSVIPPTSLYISDVHGKVTEEEKEQIISEIIAKGIKFHVTWIDCIAEHELANGQICKLIEIDFSASAEEGETEVSYITRFHGSYECNSDVWNLIQLK